MKNKKLLHDIVLIFALLVLAAAVAVTVSKVSKKGGTVEVLLDGKVFGTFPIESDARINVDGRLSVVISGGQVSVEDAVCRDLVCQKHRPVSRAGESIVCLPGGVVVRIRGDGEVDALI